MNLTFVLIIGGAAVFFLLLSIFMLVRLREPKREVRYGTRTPRQAEKGAGQNVSPKPSRDATRTAHVTPPPAPVQRASEYRRDNDDRRDGGGDFATSALVAGATNNAVLGYLVGGSLTGALIGDALVDTIDTASTSFDSSSSDTDTGGFDSDSSASDDW
ncbi:hypothetical protein F7T25_15790 [Salmonella enterica]|nr:hypothetical protein [Salmonella enterica]